MFNNLYLYLSQYEAGSSAALLSVLGPALLLFFLGTSLVFLEIALLLVGCRPSIAPGQRKRKWTGPLQQACTAATAVWAAWCGALCYGSV